MAFGSFRPDISVEVSLAFSAGPLFLHIKLVFRASVCVWYLGCSTILVCFMFVQALVSEEPVGGPRLARSYWLVGSETSLFQNDMVHGVTLS